MLSQRLKELRDAKGLTQLELSRELGIAPSTIGMYETGRREPDFDTLKKSATYFNVSPNYLIGWEDIHNVQTAEETSFLDGYRQLNADGQKLILTMLDSLRLTHAHI